jgi:hypothetical protein
MAFLSPHVLLTVHGDAWGTIEEWSIGLRCVPTGELAVDTQTKLQNIVNSAAAPTETMHKSTTLSHPAPVRLTHLKAAAIATDGTYFTDPGVAEYTYLAPVAGVPAYDPASTFIIPQSSLVVSLRTALSRGFASKGRIYLPPCGLAIAAGTGLISTGDVTAVGNTIKTWINALNAIAEIDSVAVFSKGHGVKTVDGAGKVHYTYPDDGWYQPVTSLRVGRVHDTQRRRRRSLPEEPVSINL